VVFAFGLYDAAELGGQGVVWASHAMGRYECVDKGGLFRYFFVYKKNIFLLADKKTAAAEN